MNEKLATVLKVILWIIMVPAFGMIYGITLLTSYRLDQMGNWSWAFSLAVVMIYVPFIALRKKIKGGVTVAVLYATIVDLIFAYSFYAWLVPQA